MNALSGVVSPRPKTERGTKEKLTSPVTQATKRIDRQIKRWMETLSSRDQEKVRLVLNEDDGANIEAVLFIINHDSHGIAGAPRTHIEKKIQVVLRKQKDLRKFKK